MVPMEDIQVLLVDASDWIMQDLSTFHLFIKVRVGLRTKGHERFDQAFTIDQPTQQHR
jgi:hypothetical protein